MPNDWPPSRPYTKRSRKVYWGANFTAVRYSFGFPHTSSYLLRDTAVKAAVSHPPPLVIYA